MGWLKLNSVESCEPLSNIFDNLSLVGRCIHLSNIRSYYTNVHPLLYSLYKYAREYFISVVADKCGNSIILNIISSDDKPIDKIIGMLLTKQIQTIREEELQPDVLDKLINVKKYTLLDFYLKLALRECLRRISYQPRIVGRRILWSRGNDDILYSLDADLDPSTLKGYVSVDIRVPSGTTLWDKVFRKSTSSNELWRLIDANVMVPYGDRYAYGKIRRFIPKKVSETLTTVEGKQLNLLDYYTRKGIYLDPNEQPVVEIEIISPEPRGSSILYYPPSQVRLFLPTDTDTDKHDLHARYDRIGDVLEDLIEHLNVQGISFREATIFYRKSVDVIKEIKLRYYNMEKYTSPLFSMQKLSAKPLHGPVDIPKLLILLPKSVLARKNDMETIKIISRLIQSIYCEYNLGTIDTVRIHFYKIRDTPDDQKIEFSDKLAKLLRENTPTDALIMPVINYCYLFKLAKQICSDRFFHARIVEEETFVKVMELVVELGVTDSTKIIEQYKEGKVEDKQLEQLLSILSNIVFSIYVEFVLQSETYNRRLPSKLTWALAKPADNAGKSLYIGYDISRNVLDRSEVAVAFVLYDSYGYMLNVAFRQVHGEKISRDVLENILLSLFKPLIDKRGMDRLVIYKDGGIRSKGEFKNIMTTFLNIGKKIGLKQIDVVGVIKHHNLRLFAKKRSESTIANPKIGTWVKIWDIIRHGIYAERALVVSSEAKAGGTVKPVLLERYRSGTSKKTIDEIVDEYLRLCRLNYWNPINGLNKFPLPVFMADKLAYLALQGIQIKTPTIV